MEAMSVRSVFVIVWMLIYAGNFYLIVFLFELMLYLPHCSYFPPLHAIIGLFSYLFLCNFLIVVSFYKFNILLNNLLLFLFLKWHIMLTVKFSWIMYLFTRNKYVLNKYMNEAHNINLFVLCWMLCGLLSHLACIQPCWVDAGQVHILRLA